MIPGFTHSAFQVNGLIGQIDWHPWGVAVQEAFAFGVDGTSVIEGGLKSRPFSFPMMVWGYSSVALRDRDFFQIELQIGSYGNFQARTPNTTIVNADAVRFAAMKPGRSGYDYQHGYWRELHFDFVQLVPPVQLNPDNTFWSFG